MVFASDEISRLRREFGSRPWVHHRNDLIGPAIFSLPRGIKTQRNSTRARRNNSRSLNLTRIVSMSACKLRYRLWTFPPVILFVHSPSNSSLSSRLASLLSRRSCRSISWLMRFCSFASSDKQHSMLFCFFNFFFVLVLYKNLVPNWSVSLYAFLLVFVGNHLRLTRHTRNDAGWLERRCNLSSRNFYVLYQKAIWTLITNYRGENLLARAFLISFFTLVSPGHRATHALDGQALFSRDSWRSQNPTDTLKELKTFALVELRMIWTFEWNFSSRGRNWLMNSSLFSLCVRTGWGNRKISLRCFHWRIFTPIAEFIAKIFSSFTMKNRVKSSARKSN